MWVLGLNYRVGHTFKSLIQDERMRIRSHPFLLILFKGIRGIPVKGVDDTVAESLEVRVAIRYPQHFLDQRV
ncbi:MAG: hypothetical protein IKF18_03800, partial [Erysipelotrichaceae bacterium]|nr:hypothetical protein [Erysipelotrichaceae bacterium]